LSLATGQGIAAAIPSGEYIINRLAVGWEPAMLKLEKGGYIFSGNNLPKANKTTP